MGGDAEMQHSTPMMGQNYEDKRGPLQMLEKVGVPGGIRTSVPAD
jgi:hypothetical protein